MQGNILCLSNHIAAFTDCGEEKHLQGKLTPTAEDHIRVHLSSKSEATLDKTGQLKTAEGQHDD